MAFDLGRALEGKALAAHPAFMSRTPVTVYSPNQPRKDAVISPGEHTTRHQDAYGGAQAIDWVYDCIGLYTDPVATAPYRLEKPDGTKLVRIKNKLTPADHEVGPEGLYKLLDKPNPFMLYGEFLSLLVIDLMLIGNAYWFKWNPNTPAAALYRLAPSHVKIVPDRYGPAGYEYQPPGTRTPMKIKPENMIHFRRANPHSAYYGMGVIQGAGRSMDLELALTDTMAAYYENNADPSMIIQAERRVPRDVFHKLRAQLRARTAGPRNAGELLVLENGLKASSLSPSARDALFQDLSKMSRDRIFTKFRASPMLFGIMDETSGSNKVSDVRREFDNYALRPFIARLQEQISVALGEEWGVKFIIDHRQTLPPEEAIKVGESVGKIPGVKVREVRKQYEQFGISESSGDPELDEMILNEPLGDLGPDGQPLDPRVRSGPDKPLSSEAGRPPIPRNTSAIGRAGQKALTFDEVQRVIEGKAMISSTPAPDNRLPGEKRPSDNFSTARSVDITAVSVSMAAELRDATSDLERALLDHVEGKALKTSDIVQRMRRSPAWKTFEDRVRDILVRNGEQAASSAVMHSGLTPDEEVDYNEIAENVVLRSDGLRSIIRTLKDRVARRVKEARDRDAERTDYNAAVRAVISEWNDAQAVTVAETEAVHAYNEATLVAAELSGVTQVYVTDGNDHDEPCVEANGQVWDIATARERRLEHPRCRRAFLPLTAEAVA